MSERFQCQPIQPRGKRQEPQTEQRLARNDQMPSAWFDPNGRCWRTFRASLTSGYSPFSETWRAGLIAAGVFLSAARWERRIAVIWLWIVAHASDRNRGRVNPVDICHRLGSCRMVQKRQVGLEHQVQMVGADVGQADSGGAGRMGAQRRMEYEEAGERPQWRLRCVVQMW